MLTRVRRRFSLTALGGLLAAGVLAGSAPAQVFRTRPMQRPTPRGTFVFQQGPVLAPPAPRVVSTPQVLPSWGGMNANPNWLVAPGLTVRQYAYDLSLLGYSQVPQYMLGFNLYPQYLMYGPVYNGMSPLASYYSLYPTFGYGLYNPNSFLPLDD